MVGMASFKQHRLRKTIAFSFIAFVHCNNECHAYVPPPICQRPGAPLFVTTTGPSRRASRASLSAVDRVGSPVKSYEWRSTKEYGMLQYETFVRVATPALAAATIAGSVYTSIAHFIAELILSDSEHGADTLNLILNDNSNQFIQNVHNIAALLFSFLTGHTYFFMYRQHETFYYAVFEEVGHAESLIEQCALVSGGRPNMYSMLLQCIERYIRDDLMFLNRPVQKNTEDREKADHRTQNNAFFLPADLLSRRPVDDSLETILFLTSVGTPSKSVYDTIRSLRKSRAKRLGALQLKMPDINFYLLFLLGGTALMCFPLLGAATETVGGMGIWNVERLQWSLGVFGIGICLGIIIELKHLPKGRGAYNAQSVLDVMAEELLEELKTRLDGLDRNRNEWDVDDQRKGETNTATASAYAGTRYQDSNVEITVSEGVFELQDTEKQRNKRFGGRMVDRLLKRCQ